MKIVELLKNAASPTARDIARDLKRLDSVKSGLAKKAVNYVVYGEEETVLATLNAVGGGLKLNVCDRYVYAITEAVLRRKMLVRMQPYDVALVARYMEVLNAATPHLPDHAVGSEEIPSAVRIFLTEAFYGVPEEANIWPQELPKLQGKGLTVECLLQVVEKLGGSSIDAIEGLFASSSGSYGVSGNAYREIVDVVPILCSDPEVTIGAALRLPAIDRAILIDELTKTGDLKDEMFLSFLVNQAGDSAKVTRQSAQSALHKAPSERVEALAIERLNTGTAALRSGMVNLLAQIGSARALETLKDHRKVEKTARIIAAIDTALSIADHSEANQGHDKDDHSSYIGISGVRIEIPELRPLADGEAPHFGEEDKKILLGLIEEENIKRKKQNEENQKNGYKWRNPPLKENLAERSLRIFNGEKPASGDAGNPVSQFLRWEAGAKWARSALSKLPDAQALKLSVLTCYSARNGLQNFPQDAFAERIQEYVFSANGDLRYLEILDIETGAEVEFGPWGNRKKRKLIRGDFLRVAIQDNYSFYQTRYDHLPNESVWPYLAENFDILDEAFGMAAKGEVKLDRIAALAMLAHFPEPPQRYFGALLEAATGETKAGRAEARAMLGDIPEVEARLVVLLGDSRQAVRAGAADWLAQRRDASAVTAIRDRLKKEKSDVARAAMLSALERLDEDLSEFLGPEALKVEAEKGLKKAKFDKLDWMRLENLPKCRFKNGDAVPTDILRWWLFLAFKLKQPGGNSLLHLYLSQLMEADAETFSTWVLDNWVNYDTVQPPESEANAYAKANAKRQYQSYKVWIDDYSEERAFVDLKNEFLSRYLNSGAATKGVLALACKASPVIAADRVRSYLKNHGSRTSQASALLDVLSDIGDPATLQVLISAATRLKQKSVQAYAGGVVQRVADKRGWSMDELGDRTIPTAGFDDDGVLMLPVLGGSKIYSAVMTSDLKIDLRNADGKTIKALPSSQDDESKASKKQLSSSKKELKQIVSMQTVRLYEALCAERTWPIADWLRDFHEHPVMRRLVERVVWIGLDETGAAIFTFRPTAEGDFTNEEDEDVDPGGCAAIRVAHGALLKGEQTKAWAQHLEDYEITPLFTQFGRALMRLDEKLQAQTMIEDRKGWVTDTFTLRGVASKLGYERGDAEDGGFFYLYRKGFRSAGITAMIEFSGNCLPEENVPAALISLSFQRNDSRYGGGAVKLSDVPPVLLSECWNDYRAMADKAVFDDNWEKKIPW